MQNHHHHLHLRHLLNMLRRHETARRQSPLPHRTILQRLPLPPKYPLLNTDINFDYSDRLREILIDSASYILHSISTKDNPNQNYLKIVPSIIYFIKANNTEGARPSIRFMRDSIFLCLDLIQIYDKKIEEYFKDPFLGQTLEVLGKHNANGEQQDVIEFAKMVLPRL